MCDPRENAYNTNMCAPQLTEDSTSDSAHPAALKDALCCHCQVGKSVMKRDPKLHEMKSIICVLLLGLLLVGMASCHGINTLTGGPGTTADWSSKGRRQGTLIERIVISSANEIPTDRPSSSGGVVMFTGDSLQLERMQRAQARRRGWSTSLSDGLRASTARHGTVAAVTNGQTFDPIESRRDLDGSLFDQVCA